MIKAGHRLYFVDAKVDTAGSRYVAISELRQSNKEGESRERHRIHIYEEDMPRFLDAMGDALTALAEERRRNAGIAPEAAEPLKSETAETLGFSTPAQVEIPSLDDILRKEEQND